MNVQLLEKCVGIERLILDNKKSIMSGIILTTVCICIMIPRLMAYQFELLDDAGIILGGNHMLRDPEFGLSSLKTIGVLILVIG